MAEKGIIFLQIFHTNRIATGLAFGQRHAIALSQGFYMETLPWAGMVGKIIKKQSGDCIFIVQVRRPELNL